MEKRILLFISSLKEEFELAIRAVRGHWNMESMHWHLDVIIKKGTEISLLT